jgi:hypothetical protein
MDEEPMNKPSIPAPTTPLTKTPNAVYAILVMTAVDACIAVYRLYLTINMARTCDFKGKDLK